MSKYLRIVIALLAFILCLDTLDLMRMGKFHIGIIFSFIIAVIVFIYCLMWQKWLAFINRSKYYSRLWNITWMGFTVWLISVILFFNVLRQTNSELTTTTPPEVIIVLGSGIEGHQPSATLAQRLDQAGQLYRQFPHSQIVVTGGVGFNRTLSEAQVMSQYLQQHYNIPSHKILQESQSTSTYLNLLNSKTLLLQQHFNLSQPITIVTSDFHTLRAQAIALKLGYQQPSTLSAPTPVHIRYYSWLREYFAFLSGWLLDEY